MFVIFSYFVSAVISLVSTAAITRVTAAAAPVTAITSAAAMVTATAIATAVVTAAAIAAAKVVVVAPATVGAAVDDVPRLFAAPVRVIHLQT